METTIQLQEEQAITVRELDPTADLALKHDQLTSERSVLTLKSADRPERRNQQPQKEEEQRDHPGRRYVILLPDQTDDVFGTHRARVSHSLWAVSCTTRAPCLSVIRAVGQRATAAR